MKGKVEMLYPIFITMSAFLSVTWADGTTMVTEQTTMVTDDGTDGFAATLWQETTEEIITTDETTPEVGGTIETTEEINTTEIWGRNETTEEINTTEIWGRNVTNVTEQSTEGTGKPSEESSQATGSSTVTTVTEQSTEGTGKTSEESSPATGSSTETTEEINTTEIWGRNISCYVCSSNTTSEDDECYVKQGNQSDKADCDKSCLITHIQREDSKERIKVIRSCGQCTFNSWENWACIIIRHIEICTYCCDSDGCNDHMGNGANILMQPNFILTVSATVTGMYLAA